MRSRRFSSRGPARAGRATAGLAALGAAAFILAAASSAAAQDAPPAAPAPPSATPAAEERPRDGGNGRAVAGMVRGTVRDFARRPIGGCLVQLVARDASGLLRVTGTNEGGEYSFHDLPAGVYDVEVATADGTRQTKEKIAVRPPFRNIVDFAIGKGAPPGSDPRLPFKRPAPPAEPPAADGPSVAVRGTFVDHDKRPIAEVSVTLVPAGGGAPLQAFSEEDGAFRVPAVPAGRYRILIASPGHVALDLKAVEIAAPAGLDLMLTLVDSPLDVKERRDAPPPEEPRPAPPAEPPPA